MTELERILDEGRQIPVLPAAVLRLFALARDPNAGIAEVEAAVRPDVTLTANVLRLANSATYGQPRRIDNIGRAVLLLGIQKMCDLAASSHMLQIAGMYVHGYGGSPSEFWTHCWAVALISETIAKRNPSTPTKHAFVCGVLHDLGKVAVSQALLDRPFELSAPPGASRADWLQAERAVLGTDHAEVGGGIADIWQLPPMIGQVIRWHHAPDGSPEDARATSGVVYVANGLAHAMGFGSESMTGTDPFDPQVAHRLGLKGCDLEDVARDTQQAIASAQELRGGR